MSKTLILYFFLIPSVIIINLCLFQVLKYAKKVKVNDSTSEIKVYTSKNITIFLKIGLLFFCIFGAYSGDWMHYLDEIQLMHRYTNSADNHLEPIYLWLINNITGSNYILFRIIIWTVSVWFLSNGIKRLDLDNVATWISFIALSAAISYSVGRGSLGFSLIVWGFSYIYRPYKNKSISYLKGITLLSLSLFCHKSLILFTPLVLIAIIKITIPRLVLLSLLIPSITIVFRKLVIEMLLSEEGMDGKAYFSGEMDTYTGIGYNLWQYSYYFIIFSILVYSIYQIIILKKEVPQYIVKILNLVIILLIEYLLKFRI